MSAHPSIFLSSCFQDPLGSALSIRQKIRELTGGSRDDDPAPRAIWMAEDFPELRPESPLLPLDKAEFCLDGVRDSECLVVVLTRRHGSPIAIGSGTVPSSFFELELFEAALLGKPAFVFLHEGYEPDAKLARLLRILHPSFPGMNLTPMSEAGILRQVERLLKLHERPRWLRRLSTPHLGVMVDTFFHLRHRPYRVSDEPPPLRFVDGLDDPALGPPDPDLIRTVLARARATPQHQKRLTLLWLAIRALMGAPFASARFRSHLPLWEEALSAWANAGAWYGLHAHAAMGCLAALGSLADARVGTAPPTDRSRGIPHGPIASAYYSIANLSGASRDLFDLALRHVEASLEFGGNAGQGLAIRASINLRMGRTDAAITDYKEVVALKEACGDAAHGEALSELGYALLVSGGRRDGLEKMERGLELLRTVADTGFTVRAMRKLAVGYARSAKFSRALDLAAEAHDVAVALGARDQIRTIERLAWRLDRARFWRR